MHIVEMWQSFLLDDTIEKYIYLKRHFRRSRKLQKGYSKFTLPNWKLPSNFKESWNCLVDRVKRPDIEEHNTLIELNPLCVFPTIKVSLYAAELLEWFTDILMELVYTV